MPNMADAKTLLELAQIARRHGRFTTALAVLEAAAVPKGARRKSSAVPGAGAVSKTGKRQAGRS